MRLGYFSCRDSAIASFLLENRLEEMRIYDAGDSLTRRHVFEYSGSLLSERLTYDGDGNLEWTVVYTHNANSQRSGGTRYDPSGGVLSTFELSYDSDGNLTEALFLDSGGATRSESPKPTRRAGLPRASVMTARALRSELPCGARCVCRVSLGS